MKKNCICYEEVNKIQNRSPIFIYKRIRHDIEKFPISHSFGPFKWTTKEEKVVHRFYAVEAFIFERRKGWCSELDRRVTKDLPILTEVTDFVPRWIQIVAPKYDNLQYLWETQFHSWVKEIGAVIE
jgi:hypothetical protein